MYWLKSVKYCQAFFMDINQCFYTIANIGWYWLISVKIFHD